MTIEEALYSYLSTYAGLVALIGTRIYQVRLPQTPTLPAVTYMRVSAPRLQAFDGTAKTTARFQLSAWATSYAGAKAVAAQLVAALDSYSGTMGGVGGVPCDCTVINDVDLVDPETGWYQVATDFEVWF
jgi:hypothetical protein